MIYKLGEYVPKIGKNNYIAESASVIGKVETGENVSIWFSAVLRGDMSLIKIGNGSNVQDEFNFTWRYRFSYNNRRESLLGITVLCMVVQ